MNDQHVSGTTFLIWRENLVKMHVWLSETVFKIPLVTVLEDYKKVSYFSNRDSLCLNQSKVTESIASKNVSYF